MMKLPGRDIVCIGASAGGVDLLIELAARLPADYPGTLFIVMHLPPDNPSVLARLIDRRSALRCSQAEDGERFERGAIYVAPPDHHLLVKRGTMRVTRGPRENGFRPAVDPLFRTAGLAYGPRAVGVILSGNLDDGTVGMSVIRRHGGTAIAQDPHEAVYSGMPQSVIERVGVDHVIRVSELPELLMRLAHEPAPDQGVTPMSDEEAEIEMEMDIAEMEPDAITSAIRPGTASGYGCPECGGALFSLTNGDLTHFRCRVGHAWSTDALLNRQGETLDAALWTALRALEENMALSLSVAARMRRRGHQAGARRFEDQAQIARRNADTIRHVLSQERGSGGSQRPASVLHADIGAPAGAIDPAPDTGP